MRRIAVIGAGQAGLIFAHALLKQGYEIDLYSDRSADAWLNDGPPTGTAFLYENTLDIDRTIGIDHWSDEMFGGEGVHLDFCPTVGSEERLVAMGRFPGIGAAVDQRLKIHRWMGDFEAAGGGLHIESVTPERADAIAAEHDLTVLAAGKANLAALIARDARRSVYDKPQRNLAMAIVEGISGWSSRADFVPVKFYFFGDAGEFFWVPYTHKSGKQTWCVLFEAKAGGAMDRFGECQSGEQTVAVAREVIRDLAPWDYELVKDMQLVDDDPHAWLKGRFPPTVRQAYGDLPCGKPIMPLGDTAITFDPVGGQGGNNASRHAWFTAQAVLERDTEPFDRPWMAQVREGFWQANGRAAYTFNNLLLEPLTEAGQLVLGEAARNRVFADQCFFGNFPYPNNFFPWMEDAVAARDLIAAPDRW